MKSLFYSVLAGLIILLYSCSEDNEQARLSIRLTDAPGEYQEVLIDVQEVKVNYSGADDSGWKTLTSTKSGIYNLLDFTNGMDTLLADEYLVAGKISQMRLVLGDDNQIKVNDEYYELKTPSAQQSGLKFNIHADLEEGITYRLWIDFDAGRSIIKKGNGDYSLKPVIRTYTDATSGAIKGNIKPVAAKPYMMAISANNDTLGTYADQETGFYMFAGAEPGIYMIKVKPVDGYLEKSIEGVEVSIGEVKELEEIIIDEDTTQ